tara:strand:- start:14032 stop:14619 length:588 start_codon:yes stop_codon:yes gene_type:complete
MTKVKVYTNRQHIILETEGQRPIVCTPRDREDAFSTISLKNVEILYDGVNYNDTSNVNTIISGEIDSNITSLHTTLKWDSLIGNSLRNIEEYFHNGWKPGKKFDIGTEQSFFQCDVGSIRENGHWNSSVWYRESPHDYCVLKADNMLWAWSRRAIYFKNPMVAFGNPITEEGNSPVPQSEIPYHADWNPNPPDTE